MMMDEELFGRWCSVGVHVFGCDMRPWYAESGPSLTGFACLCRVEWGGVKKCPGSC